MEVDDLFEDWDENFILAEDNEDTDSEQEEEDSDDDDKSGLKCPKCAKKYHTKGWLNKHIESCNGHGASVKSKKKVTLSDHQRKTRETLTKLGFEEYFICECVPSILKSLRVITSTSSDTVKLRGSRFAASKAQADVLVVELEKSEATAAKTYFEYVAKEVWTLTFARDNLASSSRRRTTVCRPAYECISPTTRAIYQMG